jgi:hypothetical protein
MGILDENLGYVARQDLLQFISDMSSQLASHCVMVRHDAAHAGDQPGSFSAPDRPLAA